MNIKSFSSRTRECSEPLTCKTAIFLILLLTVSGCSQFPIRDGGLAVGKDTTARIKNLGVASLDSKF